MILNGKCTLCGNKVLDGVEICDGPTTGCNADCSGNDPGFTCTTAHNAFTGKDYSLCEVVRSVSASDCGNGVLESPEKCDDGNNNSNDGCSSNCQIDANYICVTNNGKSVCN